MKKRPCPRCRGWGYVARYVGELWGIHRHVLRPCDQCLSIEKLEDAYCDNKYVLYCKELDWEV